MQTPTVVTEPFSSSAVATAASAAGVKPDAVADAVESLHRSLVDGADAILAHYETLDAPEAVAIADGLAAVAFVDDARWRQTLDTHDVPEALGDAVRAVHAATARDADVATPHGADRGDSADGADRPDRTDLHALVLPSRTVGELVRAGLSARQAEVQVLHDAGRDYAAIADCLGIAESTVKVHRHRIQEKAEDAKRLLDVVEA